MWTRAQVKQRGKFGFKANYWKSVLVAVIISCIAAGSFSFGGAGGSSVTDDFLSDQISKAEDHIMGWDDTDRDDDWDDDDWDDNDWDDDFMSGFQQGYNSVDGASDADLDVIRAGMAALIGFQSFINIGVATELLPNTGLPLPFVSYGLTSLLSYMAGIGIVLNIGLQRHY